MSNLSPLEWNDRYRPGQLVIVDNGKFDPYHCKTRGPASKLGVIAIEIEGVHAGFVPLAWVTPYERGVGMKDLTIRELQTRLPWTVHYHRDFRASPIAHKDFGHALLHIQKAAGKLAAVVNSAEHGGSEFKPEEVDRYVADLVVCALRMANTCPGRQIDLQRAVEERIESKNNAELRGVSQ